MTAKGSNFCAAFGCSNKRSERRDLSFFRFPKDAERSVRWVVNCRRKDLDARSAEYLYDNCRLCSLHFEDNQFMDNKSRNKLVWNAIPTKFDVPNPPPLLMSKRAPPKPRLPPPTKKVLEGSEGPSREICSLPSPVQQVPTVSAKKVTLSPRKLQMKKQIQQLRMANCRLRNKVAVLENMVPMKVNRKTAKLAQTKLEQLKDELSSYLDGTSLEFVMCQVRQGKKKSKGRRWSPRDKSLAISLLHSSPKTYRLLQQIFKLPSVSTLRKEIAQIKIYPGFNNPVFETLALKVKGMQPKSKVCAIILDEMSIKESVSYNSSRDEVEGFEDFGNIGRTRYIANHAITFLVRGLSDKWKQPLGFFLSSGPMGGDTMTSLLRECVSKVQEVGLIAKVVIADQGSNNRNMIHSRLGVTAEKPWFLHEGKKVFVMYDPPHLLKNIRNNLKKQPLSVDGQNVSWDYIEQFYAKDSKLPIRMAPKLTHKHVDLPPFSSLRVKYASQILSHSVAAGISTMVSLQALPSEAQHTANFISKMDKLFNSFNSQTLSSSAPMRGAISEKSCHISFLNDVKGWLQTVQPTKGRKLPCIEGWILDINSLLQLWEELHTEYSFDFLLTNRLNQDCLENLFSIIRGKGGHRDNPDAQQFRTAFRQVLVDALLVTSKSANCKEDVDAFLFSLCKNASVATSATLPEETQDAQEWASMLEMPASVKELMSVMVMPQEHNRDSEVVTQEDNILTYIAGYICRRMQGKTCQQCFQRIIGEIDESNPDHQLLINKKYSSSVTGLMAPSPLLMHVIRSLEIKFREVVPVAIHQERIRAKIFVPLSKLPCMGQLVCHNSDCKLDQLIVNLFVTMRLHFSLKLGVRDLSVRGMKRNRKTMKFMHI